MLGFGREPLRAARQLVSSAPRRQKMRREERRKGRKAGKTPLAFVSLMHDGGLRQLVSTLH